MMLDENTYAQKGASYDSPVYTKAGEIYKGLTRFTELCPRFQCFLSIGST